MQLSDAAILRLYRITNISPAELKTNGAAQGIIIDHPVNLIYLISGKTPERFSMSKPKDSNSMKLARVLNIILLNHFETIELFFEAFSIDYVFINDLWGSEIRNPRGAMIRKLIEAYDIDPIYLFGNKQSIYINSKNVGAV